MRRSEFRRAAAVVLAATMLLSGSGCRSAGETAVVGAAVGAAAGLGLGSLSGEAGDGAAFGAWLGAHIGFYWTDWCSALHWY